jgi:tetratricopeptide (TPR) repeat protein
MKKNNSKLPLHHPAETETKRKGGAAPRKKQTIVETYLDNVSVHVIFLILIPLLVYFKTIYFDFIYDDLLIRNNAGILSHFSSIKEAFLRDAFFQKPGTTYYRPMQIVSFVFDAMVSGDFPWMFHLTNIIIHICSVVSLYFLMKLLDIKNRAAFAASLLFAVHPLVGGGVAWVSSRGDLLLGLWGLWLFITMIYYGRTGKIIFLFAHAACFLLAVFSKETAAALPLLLGLFAFLYLRKSYKTYKAVMFAGIWAACIVLFYVMKSIYVRESWAQTEVGIKPFINNLSYCPALISRITIPVSLPFMPVFDSFSIISGIVLLLPLCYGAYYAYMKKLKIPVLGIAWFLIMMLPPLLYRQRNFDHDIMQLEQRMYLPLMGVAVIIAFVYQSITKESRLKSLLIPMAILLLFSGLTLDHCEDYRNTLQFTSAAIRKNPENSAAYTYQGYMYTEQQNYPKAIEDYDKAITISQYSLAYMNRGWVKGLMGDFKGAEMDYSEFIKRDSSRQTAFLQRGEARRIIGKYDEALQDMERARKIDPGNPRIYVTTGMTYNNQKRFAEAIAVFSHAIELDPGDYLPYQGRAFAYMNLGNFAEVAKDCEVVTKLRPDNTEFYIHLGDAQRFLSRFDEAITAYSTAIRLDAACVDGYIGRGLTREAQHDIPGAVKDWESALKCGYEPARNLLQKYASRVKK